MIEQDDNLAAIHDFSEARVLLIDSNRDVATLTEKFLLRKGFMVTAYTDPMLALAHFSADHEYSLVLIEANMSDMDGFDVASRIKKIDPKSKVLLMTSSILEHMSESQKESKVDGLIEKPVRLSSIADHVEEFLRSFENGKAARTYHR